MGNLICMNDSSNTNTQIDQENTTSNTNTEKESAQSSNEIPGDNTSQPNQENQQEVGEIQKISIDITDNLLSTENNEQNDNQDNNNDTNDNNQEDQSNEQNSPSENDTTEADTPTDDADQNNNTETESQNQLFTITTTYSDEAIQSAYDHLIDFDEIPDSSMFSQILQKAHREKLAAINSQDYDKAKRIEEIINLINRENDSVAFQAPYNSETRYLHEREVRLQQRFRDTKVKYKSKLEKHTENSEFRLQQLKDKHQKEIDDLRTKYQDPAFLRTFNRPSKQLITMRKSERKLALAKQYEEARKVKILADREQQHQERKMQETAKQSMQNEYIKLIDRQQRETEKMMEFDKKTVSDIQTAKHKELSPIKVAIRQTAVRRANSEQSRQAFHSSTATDSNPKFSSSVLAAKHYNPMIAKDISSKSQRMPTPRTMLKMKMIRDRNTVELKVDPIQNSTFDKLEQISQRKFQSLLPKL